MVSRVDESSSDKTELSEELFQVLGYLNFSTGQCAPKTLRALNRLYDVAIQGSPFEGLPAWL
ncbi:MAG TPA: hypothetical protein DDW52_30040, partial [Planctomycetaceae bacterium]|nr:hypothetical protein [Planctomycetaceae bacterium]